MTALNLPEPPEGARLSLRPRGRRLQSLTLELKTVTPILGGGPVARRLSEVDIIRVPTLRGHLRFWWRALYGHAFTAGGEHGRLELARKERELWGGMGLGSEPASRSQVELRVTKVQTAGGDESKIHLGSPPAYALWPARNPPKEPDLPRWRPGLQFTLELLAPEGESLEQVHRALRAWVLFGGYGSRTRRGCGCVTLVSAEQRRLWLPRDASRAELRRLFGDVPLLQPENEGPPCDLPLLRGAHLYRSAKAASQVDATKAWVDALNWLHDFRQGTTPSPGQRLAARKPGEQNRQGRSNWPEADKIRHHARPTPPRGGREDRSRQAPPPRAYPEEHAPRPEHTRVPVWPRAGFGLPIVVHFQPKDRQGVAYDPPEPDKVQLQWEDSEGTLKDRLASPLIVKALPLADGRFEPIALWLERGHPKKGRVVMVQRNRPNPDTRAEFDLLRAPGDRPLFWPLQQRERGLRGAFFSWLEASGKAREA